MTRSGFPECRCPRASDAPRVPWNRHRALARWARAAAAAVVLLVARSPASAQTQSPSSEANAEHRFCRRPRDGPAMGGRAHLTGNFFPKGSQSDYLQPTATVDHGWLHLEARYAYDAPRTGSVWVGWNFSWGDSLILSLTPMFGVVFGLEKGVAVRPRVGSPSGARWRPPPPTSSSSTLRTGRDRFQLLGGGTGVALEVAQAGRRAHQDPGDPDQSPEQWGPLVGVQVWKIGAAVYWMNPGNSSDQYWSAPLSLNL